VRGGFLRKPPRKRTQTFLSRSLKNEKKEMGRVYGQSPNRVPPHPTKPLPWLFVQLHRPRTEWSHHRQKGKNV
jgi:hypothetical protein